MFLNSFIIDELYSIDIITEYLMRVDPWSLYEINLFLNASPFFEGETRNFLRNHFISSMNRWVKKTCFMFMILVEG